MSVGEELRAARTLRGVSIRELAALADVAPSTVWRIEAGRLDPTVGMLEHLMSVVRPNSHAATREAAVSLALGRLTAAAVLRDPEALLEAARRRVRTRLEERDLPDGARRWYVEWGRVLEQPLEQVVAALIDPSERGYELRQNLPFTGVVSDEDRLVAVRRASKEHRASRSA